MLEKTQAATEAKKEPIVIKKYANRRLYNTETSTYVTLDDLAEMVRSERDFVVFDAKSGEDLTHSVLTQIIVEQEGRGSSLLPVPFLRQLIRFYGDSMGPFVPSYLQLSMESLSREQERFRKQFSHLFSGKAFGAVPFGTGAIEALQEQARQNMALFERTLFSMFSPVLGGAPGSTAPGAPANDKDPAATEAPSKPQSASGAEARELAELRAQLAAMQAKIDKIADSKG